MQEAEVRESDQESEDKEVVLDANGRTEGYRHGGGGRARQQGGDGAGGARRAEPRALVHGRRNGRWQEHRPEGHSQRVSYRQLGAMRER